MQPPRPPSVARSSDRLEARPPTHLGQPQNAEAVLLGPPGPEFGELVSAASTVHRSPLPGDFRASVVHRITMGIGGAALGAIGGALVGLLVSYLMEGEPLSLLIGTGAAGLGVLGGVTGAAFFPPRQYTTWIGTEGIARVTRKGDQLDPEFVLFTAADSIRTGLTRQFVNGVYTGTAYSFIWFSAGGQPVFQIQGQFTQKEEAGVPDGHDVHFGRSAELVWTRHRLARTMDELQQRGKTRFRCGPHRWLIVEPGAVSIDEKGTVTRLDASEIQSISIAQGVLEITQPGAKRGIFSSQGIHRILISEVDNLRVMLAVMQKLLGIPIA